ncbi:hypothetical protein JNE43_11685 [Kocuria rhizophila]|uniref:hypothetical protein n=1 Tax=Kocuria rhizophila TaxID=72000 RepID=UPI001DF33DA5|nr:hypothetical protein [Kocuria rhizophila]MCC5675455.1 hypothetical protein [Kocuria rhizophila]
MLVAVPYLLLAKLCTTLLADGGPGWLNLVVLVCVWNSFKFLITGPVSVVLLVRARIREAIERRRARVSSEMPPGADYSMAEAV